MYANNLSKLLHSATKLVSLRIEFSGLNKMIRTIDPAGCAVTITITVETPH